jgi:hypothetical protein
MTSLDQMRRQQTGGRQMQQGQQGAAGGSAPGMQQTQGLPPTGIQQQLSSLNQMYSGVQGMRGGVGYDVRQAQFQQGQQQQGQGGLQQQRMGGSTSLDALAKSLAQNYGLAIGRGRLVDEHGTMLMTPDQMANASGGAETLGSAAVKMQYISQAVKNYQTEQAQQKGIAAIQTGLGQVQQRGRGSLASMQSGMYQDLADLYSNQQYASADFSYWVQKEQADIQANLMRRQEKLAKRQGYLGMAMGVGMMAAGNYAGGAAMVAGGAQGAGWF